MGLGVPGPTGVFGASKGLQEEFGKDRVFDMPSSENAMTGIALGMALMGRRPITRGMAKSHHAHPLGGGSGRSKGNRPPCGPTGVLAKGGRTRNKNKHSTKLIIRRRMTKRYGQVM